MKNTILLASLIVPCLSLGFVSDNFISLTEATLDQLIRAQNSIELEQLIPTLPVELRLNFVLKHGIKRVGERGHLIEKKVSQSADPLLPRAILWNESTGFSLSFNGGGATQTAPQRLDVLSFSQDTKTFRLSQVDFPLTEAQINDRAHSVVKADASCAECHGSRQRPIFAMYPDWPAFYGSDNDELNNPKVANQHAELGDYRNFKNNVASKHPRYSPLFEETLIQSNYGIKIWETYPLRPNTSEEARNVSRSFAFRPGLRLGIVYNRLNAQSVFKTMKDHPNYEKFAVLTLHSLLQCNWNASMPKTRAAVSEMVKSVSPTAPQWVGNDSLQLHYHQIWNLYGMKINDVDIRYSYNHEGYANIDSSKRIMEPGYIGRYFNSYFDGSATIDELIIAKLLTDLTPKFLSLKNAYRLRGLTEKYQHLSDRFRYDEKTFRNFDKLGLWFAMPYAKEVFAQQHRESFTTEMKQQHEALCAKTAEILKQQVFGK